MLVKVELALSVPSVYVIVGILELRLEFALHEYNYVISCCFLITMSGLGKNFKSPSYDLRG